MPQRITRSELVSRLVRAGELEVSGEDQAETDTYFDQENFRFDADGRLIEEFVRTDHRGLLRQLGAEGR